MKNTRATGERMRFKKKKAIEDDGVNAKINGETRVAANTEVGF